MRITNKMMTNNSLYNINNNKNALAKLEQSYSSGKKIQRPSEDPIIAVRALKLRTSLSELNQYYEKNIPDAKSWMDVTESALNNANDILTQMNKYCVQGANDPLTADDRNSLVSNLDQLKKQIYHEGNSNYAGRYVFTGYKTDKSLIFTDKEDRYNYEISELKDGSDIDIVKKSINSHELDAYDPTDPAALDLSNKPNEISSYRIRLAYNNLDEAGDVTISLPQLNAEGIPERDADGNIIYNFYADTSTNIITMNSTDPNAYDMTADPGDIRYLADTGELILGADAYSDLKELSGIKISYEKNEFKENDLRPEHYFDCTVTDLENPTATPIVYTKGDQDISYEVNFNQTLTINTQGSDALKHDIGRCVDDMLKAVDDVSKTQNKIDEVNKMLEDLSNTAEQTEALNNFLEVLKTEMTLKTEVMQTTFEKGITELKNQQNIVNTASSDLGSRYVRLELTESRLSSQQTDFTDLMSNNEDADIVDTYIKLTSQETLYNASLSATAKIVQNSLLDFL